MKIFLSYASEDREKAEEVQLALLAHGHDVFFDKESLPPGGDYQTRIDLAVKSADIFIFLISPESTSPGSFALTELKYAKTKWRHPKERVIPVLLKDTSWSAIPPYLKSVTVLEPEGSVAAEVAQAVNALDQTITQSNWRNHTFSQDKPQNNSLSSRRKVKFWGIAIFLLTAAVSAALLSQQLFAPRDSNQKQDPANNSTPPAGMKGPDSNTSNSPPLNTQCPEVTYTDYSKFPPESKIIRRCDP